LSIRAHDVIAVPVLADDELAGAVIDLRGGEIRVVLRDGERSKLSPEPRAFHADVEVQRPPHRGHEASMMWAHAAHCLPQSSRLNAAIMSIVLSGTGLHAPPDVISNDELVAAFNAWVDLEGKGEAEKSSAEFIVKASGIKRRHVVDRKGILDPTIMAPRIAERPNEAHSVQCEMSLLAAHEALTRANVAPESLDCIIVGCSNLQRPYPAVAIEVQAALGAKGFAFDMNVACSSATFALAAARDLVRGGSAQRALVVNPEINSAHLNFRNRESHFIFGDACTAMVIEKADGCQAKEAWEIVSTKLLTKYSNAIRNNLGFLARCAPEHRDDPDKLFVQEGRKVFKEVSPMVADLLLSHLDEAQIEKESVKRFWLHQANLTMNQWIARKVLGREATEEEAPNVLDEYANTSSTGSVIAFHLRREGLTAGDVGLLCSFGAGYSAGSVILKKVR
jgi:beta-ketodecanoyl-[acyl-carrier-protein] synthase